MKKSARFLVATKPLLGGNFPSHKKGEKFIISDDISTLPFKNRLLRRAEKAGARNRAKGRGK